MHRSRATPKLRAMRTAALGAVCAALLAACAPPGDDPFSRLTVYEPPSGEYRVRYLEPPWELVSSAGTTVFLRIQSNAMSVGGFEGGPGKYELVATVEPGTPAARIASERVAAVSRGELPLEGPRAVTTDADIVGQELLTQGDDAIERHFRYVYLPLDASRVLRLAFEATPSLDTSEVDAMIRLVSVGVAP